MSLQDWFYALGIIYFVSMWLVLVGIVVFAIMLFQQVKNWRRGLQHTVEALPLLSIIWPLVRKMNHWWQRH